jgi:hypothetical protein
MFKIPKSKIKTGLYTSNDEYVYKLPPKKVYKGDYYKYNGKFYAGKTFNSEETPIEIELAKKTTYNSSNFLYDVLAGVKQGSIVSPAPVRNRAAVLTGIQLANQQGFTSEVGVNNDADVDAINAYGENQVAASTTTTRKRYFYRQMFSLNKAASYKFGEVKTEDDYNIISQRPNYVAAAITETTIPGQAPFFDEKELNDAEAKMPGLKSFLENQPKSPAETVSTPAPTPTPTTPSSTATTTSSAPASTGGGGGGGSSSSTGRMIVSGAGSNLISGPPAFK